MTSCNLVQYNEVASVSTIFPVY